jgi:hypothetical protein
VGTDFDLKLMTEISRRGGGSSRFISDRVEMEKTFGSELDRMVVPVAYNLQMLLEFPQPVEILETWGYENRVEGDAIRYAQDTLHHRDYETILVHVRIPPQPALGLQELARFTVEYEDLSGNKRRSGPLALEVEFVSQDQPVSGFSNAIVLQSGTMMRFAQDDRRAILFVQGGDSEDKQGAGRALEAEGRRSILRRAFQSCHPGAGGVGGSQDAAGSGLDLVAQERAHERQAEAGQRRIRR